MSALDIESTPDDPGAALDELRRDLVAVRRALAERTAALAQTSRAADALRVAQAEILDLREHFTEHVAALARAEAEVGELKSALAAAESELMILRCSLVERTAPLAHARTAVAEFTEHKTVFRDGLTARTAALAEGADLFAAAAREVFGELSRLTEILLRTEGHDSARRRAGRN